MREKELRLAIVLTGGVSLAVHIYGVMRELQKLARASKVLHGLHPTARAQTSYRDATGPLKRETDTEPIYFDLLKSFAPDFDVRVVVDVIAGASAGGVNGAMLARALAHDLPLDSHRTMWLEHADVLHLMDERVAARRWSKAYLLPAIRLLMRFRMTWISSDLETRTKVSLFLRSRWFRPPFSGRRFIGWMLDACDTMGKERDPKSSLMPDGHALDYFVSVTDFHGHGRRVTMNDPPLVEETEHRVVLHYRYERSPSGETKSDFDEDHVPSLVFGARATSSFPGAFEPATIAEMDSVLRARGRSWRARREFLTTKFPELTGMGHDPCRALFIDGSVVDDKPFAAAINALSGRPAQREVVRRVLFVDPDPEPPLPGTDLRSPNMFRSILSAMAEIPRNDPVGRELDRVGGLNQRIRLLRRVIAQARPRIGGLVADIVAGEESDAPTAKEIAGWRHEANARAGEGAGFAFESYFRLKILTVLDHLERLILHLAAREGASLDAEQVRAALQAWLALHDAEGGLAPEVGPRRAADIDFLRRFDVDFRVRRLRFVIRRLNELYHLGPDEDRIARSEELDELKATLYRLLEDTKRRWDLAFYDESTRAAMAAFAHAPVSEALPAAVEAISRHMRLLDLDDQLDEVFSVMVLNYLPARPRGELVAAYIGFSFFDPLSFPMLQWEDLDELEEILIDRISPKDAIAIRSGGAMDALKGARLRHFSAFFNRSYRENDYLWGRLTAADRLVDIVSKAVTGAAHENAKAIKCRLFRAILKAEEPFLKADPALMAGLLAEVEALDGSGERPMPEQGGERREAERRDYAEP